MWTSVLCVLLLAFCLHAKAAEDDGEARSPQDKFRGLLTNYDKAVQPRTDAATEVKVGMYINSFNGIDIQRMEYSINFYLRMAWQDPRLKFESDSYSRIRAPQGAWDDIWTPDLFMRNEKTANVISIISPQRLLRVNATGHVWYVVKYAATLACPMKVQRFPFDTQTCPVMFESFGYTMDVMYMKWMDNPAEVDADNQLPQYTLIDAHLNDCSQNYTGGAFPCLEVQFVLRRDIGYYIFAVIIPSIILVVISWLQFWLSVDAVTGKVLVGLFTTFTIVGQMSSLRGTLPKVSYLTTLDVWMMICCLFIFATLIELAIVQVFVQRNKQENDGENKGAPLPKRIDFISRIAYPAVFLAFNFLFWIIMSV